MVLGLCLSFYLKIYASQSTFNTISGSITSGHGENYSNKDLGEIRIGLLLPLPPESDPLALSAFQGAELAIEQANEQGGFENIPFKLLIRTTEGLWGAGSKEAVKFVYDDEVSAMLTALDGRNAHLAEQVATKAHIVQVATRATDETLSQAFVPWFFRVVPNDKQQAKALIDEIYHKQEMNRIAVFHEDGYDHKMAAETFKREALKEGMNVAGIYSFGEGNRDTISAFIDDKEGEAVILIGSYKAALPVIERIRYTGKDVRLFGTLSLTVDGLISENVSPNAEGAICISSKFCYTTSGKGFKNSFKRKYNRMPDPAASYAFDGMSLLIEAIRNSGPDREKIQEILADMEFSGGATGSIRFDENGNRLSPVFMIRIIKGHPVILPDY